MSKAELSTTEEKSLGCIKKGGESEIKEVLAYAQRPVKHGLVFMDTPDMILRLLQVW